jgi:hypothetical protein
LTVIEQVSAKLAHPNQVFGETLLERLRNRAVEFLLLFEESHERLRRGFEPRDSGIHFGRLQFGLAGVAFIRETRVRLNLFLKFQHRVQNGLGNRRTARNVDIYRNDLVDALHHVVGAIESTTSCAGAHRDNPPRFGHLVIDLLEDRRHLVVDGAQHH